MVLEDYKHNLECSTDHSHGHFAEKNGIRTELELLLSDKLFCSV